MHQGKRSVGHPVDIATGVLFETYQDLSLPGGMALKWDRQYSTALVQSTGIFGRGWTSRYSAHILERPGAFELHSPEGAVETFVDSGGVLSKGGVLRHLGTFQELTQTGTHLVVTQWEPAGGRVIRYIFRRDRGSVFLLSAIEGAARGALDIFYDYQGRLERVQQRREKRSLILSYNQAGFVKEVNVQTARGERIRAASYQYDNRGYLIAAEGPTGYADRYEYDLDGRMLREMRRDGGVFSFRYDDAGRCVSTRGIDGYDEKTLRFFEGLKFTEVTDSLGNVWRYQFNARGQISTSVSPRGAVRKTEYDEHGRIISTTDPRDSVTEFKYDEAGNQTCVRLTNGAEWRSEFNPARQFESVTTPEGAVWKFVYNRDGRLQTATPPSGIEWTHRWQGEDRVELSTNTGAVWKYEHDSLGQLKSVTANLGPAYRYEYDDFGYCSRVVDAGGAERRYERNLAGQLLSLQNPEGVTVSLRYDSGGNVVQRTDAITGTTGYRYGRCCGQLLEEIASNGAITKYSWSTEPDRLQSITNPKGERHLFEYDDDGYLIKETFATGKVVHYTRGIDGEVVDRTNGAGETTRYLRDACGRILKAIFCDGSETEFEYRKDGKLVGAVNAMGRVALQRDPAGRRIREDFGEFWVESAYDSTNNRTSCRSNLGFSRNYRYDELGRSIEIAFDPKTLIKMEYDSAGREVRRELPGGAVLRQTFDFMSRLIHQQVTRPAVISGLPPQSETIVDRTFRYDPLGRLSQTDERGWGPSSFVYGAAGALMGRETLESVETYQRDADANVVATSFASRPNSKRQQAVQSLVEIGPGDQVLRKDDTEFTYDGDGRLTTKTKRLSDGTVQIWKYEWNPLGLLSAVTRPDGEKWTYSYDALGRRVRKQSSSGFDQNYVWDGNALLHEVERTSEGKLVKLASWTFSAGSFRPLACQEAGRLSLAVTDQIGTPREFLDSYGTVVWAARLTPFGQVERSEEARFQNPVRFQGQWFDQESGLHYNTFRYYDPELGQYISMDPVPLLGGLNAYQYNPDPINWIDAFGLAPTYYPLDSQNRPTGAYAELRPGDLRATNSSPPTLDPPGWQGGQHPFHQQRSHLIADTLGGSGDDRGNLVTLTDGSNHPGMSTQEGTIRRYLQNNPSGSVTLEVRVEYDGTNPRPTAVHMYALDENGNVLVDERIQNGRRQNTACCNP